jgi:hypothetical protein
MALNKLSKKLIPILLIVATLVIGACTSRADSDSTSVSISADGYKSVTLIDMDIEWRVTEDTKLEVIVTGPTTGWVAVGFRSSGTSGMSGSNIIMGYVDGSGDLQIADFSASSNSTPSQDGQNDLTETSGEESGSSTTIRFTIPLNSGDSNDTALTEGSSFIMLAAYGNNGEDNFTAQHSSSKRVLQTISAL